MAEGLPVQRSWGRNGPGMFQNQRGGPCGWSRVSKEERGRRGGQRGEEQVVLGLGDHREDLGFSPKGVEALEGSGRRRTLLDSSAHGRPLVATTGRMDHEGSGQAPPWATESHWSMKVEEGADLAQAVWEEI